jgi:hypothetical protein
LSVEHYGPVGEGFAGLVGVYGAGFSRAAAAELSPQLLDDDEGVEADDVGESSGSFVSGRVDGVRGTGVGGDGPFTEPELLEGGLDTLGEVLDGDFLGWCPCFFQGYEDCSSFFGAFGQFTGEFHGLCSEAFHGSGLADLDSFGDCVFWGDGGDEVFGVVDTLELEG